MASIHRKAFPKFFIITLGEKYLKVYYKASFSRINSIPICGGEDTGNIGGFVVDSIKAKDYHKNRLFRNLFMIDELSSLMTT